MVRIMRRFTLQAAHHLPHVPEGHKCGRVHGHTWDVEVWVTGQPDDRGWFMDFAEIDVAWTRDVHNVLDHRDMNDIIPNPTTENICAWIACHLQLAGVQSIIARENGHSAIEYTL